MLGGLAGLASWPLWATESPAVRLLAAWQHGAEQHVGLFRANAARLVPGASLVVPTRAHGLLAERRGTVLAVARRPGDWLLRWHPGSGQAQWCWIDDDRRFNGHVVATDERLWTTETQLETAQGVLGVRHAASLEKTAEWPTHGMDPHQVLALPQPLGPWPAGTLMVANGGIPTLPETGRSKRQLNRMDSSLVALDPRTGRLLGQWRLADPQLSIRHLAFDARSKRLGIALQAEHPSPAAREAAPVLAVWDGDTLAPAQQQPAMQGYGGDICAHPRGGFVVSCPRADRLALFSAQAQFLRALSHPLAYALAEGAGQWWSTGREEALVVDKATRHLIGHPGSPAAAWQFDNHWQVLAG